MADLLDIAPATSVVSVKLSDTRRFVVRGLNANAIASIAARFPNLIAAFAAAGDNAVVLISSFGVAAGPVIAAGCGHLGNDEAEANANGLLVEDQMKLLNAIYGLTFPNGVGVFVDQVTAMIAPTDDKLRPVRVRLKKSPSASPPSSGADLPQTLQ